MNKLILLIISLVCLPYSYAAGLNDALNALARQVGVAQSGDYALQRKRQENEMIQAQYQNYMMEEQLQNYVDMRTAEEYVSTFWEEYENARKMNIKPIMFVNNLVNAVKADPNFINMNPRRQGLAYQLLSEKIKQLAYKLQAEGDSKSANMILSHFSNK